MGQGTVKCGLRELHGVTIDPLQSQSFNICRGQGLLVLEAAVVLDLTYLFAHSRAKQSLIISERDPDPVALGLFLAPGYVPWIACVLPQGRHAHVYSRTASPASIAIA